MTNMTEHACLKWLKWLKPLVDVALLIWLYIFNYIIYMNIT